MKIVEVSLTECPLINSFVAKGVYYLNICFAPPEKDGGEEERDAREGGH